MKRWLQTKWLAIKYRFRCPYPIDGHRSARACIRVGLCGCDNGPQRTWDAGELEGCGKDTLRAMQRVDGEIDTEKKNV